MLQSNKSPLHTVAHTINAPNYFRVKNSPQQRERQKQWWAMLGKQVANVRLCGYV